MRIVGWASWYAWMQALFHASESKQASAHVCAAQTAYLNRETKPLWTCEQCEDDLSSSLKFQYSLIYWLSFLCCCCHYQLLTGVSRRRPATNEAYWIHFVPVKKQNYNGNTKGWSWIRGMSCSLAGSANNRYSGEKEREKKTRLWGDQTKRTRVLLGSTLKPRHKFTALTSAGKTITKRTFNISKTKLCVHIREKRLSRQKRLRRAPNLVFHLSLPGLQWIPLTAR